MGSLRVLWLSDGFSMPSWLILHDSLYAMYRVLCVTGSDCDHLNDDNNQAQQRCSQQVFGTVGTALSCRTRWIYLFELRMPVSLDLPSNLGAFAEQQRRRGTRCEISVLLLSTSTKLLQPRTQPAMVDACSLSACCRLIWSRSNPRNPVLTHEASCLPACDRILTSPKHMKLIGLLQQA